MKSQPKISIITPSYNQGQYIEETINSVLSQDYPHIEYIVVDGGSTDNTLDILKKYDGKILWISEKDNGQSDAIIKGFKMAKGEIFAWLCSDDLYLPGAIKRIVEYFEIHPNVGLLYGKSHYIDEDGKGIGEYPTAEFDFERMATFNVVSQPSAFFKKEAYLQAGGVDVGLSYAMDYDLWLRVVKKSQIEYLPEYLSSYRLHEESKTVSDIHALKQSKEILDCVRKHFGFAPLSRVYAYSYLYCKEKVSSPIDRLSFITIPLAILLSIMLYIKLNKGIRLKDLKMINIENLGKIIKGRKNN